MSNQLKDLSPNDCCERSLKMIGFPAIRFVPTETQYDAEGSTSKLTVSLNLDDNSFSSSKKKRKAEDGPDAEEETEGKDNQICQKFRKLCEGDAEAYIHLMKQMNSVVKGKYCDTTK